MYIVGEKDPGCGGYRDDILRAIPQAEAEGLSNCGWQYDGLREVIANQSNSPHVFDLSPTGDHVETNRRNPVNDRVDIFLSECLVDEPAERLSTSEPIARRTGMGRRRWHLIRWIS